MPKPIPDPPDSDTPENPLAEVAVRHAERQFELGIKSRPASSALISQRSRRIHDAHRRRALQAGVPLDYTAEELRRSILRKLGAGGCPYCRQPLTPRNFAVTHKNPPRRGGRHSLTNLIVCCRMCRAAKGPLDAQEFRELLLLMRAWPEPVRRVFLYRFRHRRRPPAPAPLESPSASLGKTRSQEQPNGRHLICSGNSAGQVSRPP